jgi:hypothetical protein
VRPAPTVPDPSFDGRFEGGIAARGNYNLVVRQGDTPVTQEKVEENVSFVTDEH